MTKWTPKIEKLIRDVGDHSETEIKDLINPKTGALTSGIRVIFNHERRGHPLMKKLCKELNFQYDEWNKSLQILIDLAEKNNSDAADKIKKALDIRKKMRTSYEASHSATKKKNIFNLIKRMKHTKKQNFKFD